MKLIIHTDGGARGNPGPAAVGVVIEEETSDPSTSLRPSVDGSGQALRASKQQVTSKTESKIIARFGKRIGETTNNVAEYTAVIEALEYLKERHVTSDPSTSLQQDSGQALRASKQHVDEKVQVQFFLDSTLVVNQLNGLFKVKDAKLRELLSRVRILEQEIGGDVRYNAVPREQNRRADWMVNQALDRI